MKTEEWVAETTGVIDGLTEICAFICASSPHAEQALQRLKQRIGEIASQSPTGAESAYMRGMSKSIQRLQSAIESADLGRERSQQTPH